jgi:hypothetical protein
VTGSTPFSIEKSENFKRSFKKLAKVYKTKFVELVASILEEKLSRTEKLSILEFLQADLNLGKSSLASSDSIHPYLRRKEDILVIETDSLEHIDFNQFLQKC